MSTPTPPPRPTPVLDAAKLGGLVQVAFVTVGGVVLVFFPQITGEKVTALGTAVGLAVTALLSLIVYVTALLHGRRAAAQVTPVSAPQDDLGQALVPADAGAGFHVADAYITVHLDAAAQQGVAVQAWAPDPTREGVAQDRLEQPAPPAAAETAPGRPTLKHGRIPNDPSKPRVRLTALEVPGLAYNPPASVDWWSKVNPASWGMDGNDQVGDCTLAELDHCVKALQVAAGNPEVQSTPAEVLAAYSAVTGYKPSDPSTDQGAMMQDVRNYWRKHGVTLGGQKHTILLFAQVDHTDHALIKWCIARFGEVGLGFAFPDSAMDQFHAGQPWTVVPGTPTPTEGHAVGAVGYDDQFVYVTTWGTVQKMAWSFFDAYVDEAWTQLSEEFVSRTSGNDPLAETAYGLGQQYAAVTGQPNPIPAPSPAPTPAPQPGPAPHGGFPVAEWEAWKAHPRSVVKARALIAAVTAWLATLGAAE